MAPSLTIKRLKEVLRYDPGTGIFTWIRPTSRRVHVGMRAGSTCHNQDGARWRQIMVDGEMIREHRLAWFYMTGRWPKEEIDHRNTDSVDNVWANLREATSGQNKANRGPKKTHKIGLKGVTRYSKNRVFRARVKPNGGAVIHLGYFDCPAAAHFAYLVAASKVHGEFARGV